MNKEMFIEIMNEAGSDKHATHNYELGYVELLNRDIKNLMEIGIAHSVKEFSSLRGWSAMIPDAFIYGVDIMPEKMIDEERISTFIADQSDPEALEKIVSSLGDTKMDVIIDDGSHIFEHASTTFSVFFEKLLAPGGIYIIEDIQKSEENINSVILNQQCLKDWTQFLDSMNIKFQIIDCMQDKNDDSLLLVVEKLI